MRFRRIAKAGFGLVAMAALAGTAHADKVFYFNGLLADGDFFSARLVTEDALTTIDALAHTNVAAGLTSDAYTFTGYRVIGISGGWLEAGELTPHKIIQLFDPGYLIENSDRNDPAGPDTIAHSPTDNLFDPTRPFETEGKVSYGGLAFLVDMGGGVTEDYQLYTNRDGGYAGCPGSCQVVVEVSSPGTLPLALLGLLTAVTLGRRWRGQGSSAAPGYAVA